MNGKTLLVEIGTEELPPKMLYSLAQLFCKNMMIELNISQLMYQQVLWFASPRRLALKIINLYPYQINRVLEIRGPKLIESFDAKGYITETAKSWLHNNKVLISELETLYTIKGACLIYRKTIKGKKVNLLLPVIIEKALKKIDLPKLMRWGESNIKFIRPIHTITILFGDKLIPCSLLGIKSKKIIYGHRFMGNSKITLINADQYPDILAEKGKVIADYIKRKEIIKTGIEFMAEKLKGQVYINDKLLHEVTSLVEWPVILNANFKKEFLNIPHELLIHIIENIQKYFTIYDTKGKLLSKFILISNIESNDRNIVIGNEKVLNSRLEDAEFFFNHDRKHFLADNVVLLEKVVFHKELGSLKDKTERIMLLSKWIAIKISANVEYSLRASLLSKCDLLTRVVFEYPEMQGIMGMHFALCNGEHKDVAFAISEQYRPSFSKDEIPSSVIGCTLSIADKIDTLVGMFGIQQPPKGSKDPLALRRAAFGVLRIIIDKKLPLNLQDLIQESVTIYQDKFVVNNIVNNILDFMFRRLQNFYVESGYDINIFKAVLSVRPLYPLDFDLRMQALSNFLFLKESNELIVINKRVSNCLIKSNTRLASNLINSSLLKQKEEIELTDYIAKLTVRLQPYFTKGLYIEALIELSKLRLTIENFFNKVKINTHDNNVHINRLTLLSKIRSLFLQIADISLLKSK
ncbi:glycine--tRNA ligase subunit beta [Candidatus Pantoea edessiphila]|uniref:Glycine--tRNA ligase beta subunit n=1 Tax=Candidatus Pantoea edessiphila TaxID=2044610 RepID=A0A2P5SXB4_9GAMM|nr:glycine--tRNA ligase subunit beta [Candidatus Pantoea edessiphila]MBK4775832.1 glycine--tRNA ligase subunit beta [Pantoea sp. Edef]PPI86979.1 glycine--tRNA ligase subunit beta [Candidatus Pantoea edessiphila]